MTFDPCAPCDPCQIGLVAADNGTFKLAVLITLCGLYGQSIPSEEPATTSVVASSATVVTLLAANADRKGVTIFNDSTQVLKYKYGSGASATDFTGQIAAGGVFNMPLPIYGGIITGLWAAANGNARITEW